MMTGEITPQGKDKRKYRKPANFKKKAAASPRWDLPQPYHTLEMKIISSLLPVRQRSFPHRQEGWN